jgi:stress-induced morphogen
MITAAELESLIRKQIAGAEVKAEDLTGTQDHYRVEVIATSFQGVALIDQHRMVQGAVAQAYQDGRLHALSIKTVIPKAKG